MMPSRRLASAHSVSEMTSGRFSELAVADAATGACHWIFPAT